MAYPGMTAQFHIKIMGVGQKENASGIPSVIGENRRVQGFYNVKLGTA